MGPALLTRRLLPALAALALMVALGGTGARAATPLSIKIIGNHFVNGSGQTIRLLGVNHQSFEFACAQGFAYDDGLMDDADAAAIASWNANAVRVPLNEDCWLGINGQPNSNGGADQTLTVDGYRQAVENYVSDLHAHGLYAILDLHWSAPGSQVALEQQPMPDLDHSVDFWQSVASTFKNDPAVVFDLFNEPFDPTDPNSGSDQQHPQDKVTWDCWENASSTDPCMTAPYDENGDPTPVTPPYQIAGMQLLLNTVRGTGATQPIMVGGLNFANDLSQWATHAPNDPLNQEAASMHAYSGQVCSDLPGQPDNPVQANGLNSCFDQVASIAQNVPVVIGEFGQNATAPLCDTPGDQSYDSNLMNWADQNGVSYTAWGWDIETQDDLNNDGCSAYELISDPGGTPFAPNGTTVHSHLLSLPAGGVTPGSGTTPITQPGPTQPGPGKGKTLKAAVLRSFAATLARHHTLRLIVSSNEKCHGTASVVTAAKFGKGKRRARVSFGSGHFRLAAHAKKALSVTLPHAARRFLAAHPSVTVRVSITLVNASGRTTHVRRKLALQQPK
jgi:aryl-phospho-beta-D-glucosidase BglC (GH1 family)